MLQGFLVQADVELVPGGETGDRRAKRKRFSQQVGLVVERPNEIPRKCLAIDCRGHHSQVEQGSGADTQFKVATDTTLLSGGGGQRTDMLGGPQAAVLSGVDREDGEY